MYDNDLLLKKYLDVANENYSIDSDAYTRYSVKRGLRNADGSGVLVGLTRIGEVHGYIMDEGEKKPDVGNLRYRGISVADLVNGCMEDNRFGFEETIYLILFGKLPTRDELCEFTEYLNSSRPLPKNFTEDMILKAPSTNIMNKLARSVLAEYSYDDNPDDTSLANMLRQSIELIARFPVFIAHAYMAKAHYFDGKSLVIHSPQKNLSTAENFLYMMRADHKYTETEAKVLDLTLILHAEHGGGNNSAFTTHVVSSSGTDTYSAISAAIGSLKGPRHGGANAKVMGMMDDIKAHISSYTNEAEITDYLAKIITRQAYDGTGLVYGLGHAIYTVSDPRAVILEKAAETLAKEKGREDEMELYRIIKRTAPKLFAEIKGHDKILSPNVDFFSGFVYSMLDIPRDVYTPMFAMARVPGWCAHRIEEMTASSRIIRPAYKSMTTRSQYVKMEER
ncbi:MAG: citrate/2-methylcitrate synthase [Clostridia bacterium]|nr:citrate/2-methylcitrate synthase [Clostridia bacterium]